LSYRPASFCKIVSHTRLDSLSYGQIAGLSRSAKRRSTIEQASTFARAKGDTHCVSVFT
jgi:hypothetical protein